MFPEVVGAQVISIVRSVTKSIFRLIVVTNLVDMVPTGYVQTLEIVGRAYKGSIYLDTNSKFLTKFFST